MITQPAWRSRRHGLKDASRAAARDGRASPFIVATCRASRAAPAREAVDPLFKQLPAATVRPADTARDDQRAIERVGWALIGWLMDEESTILGAEVIDISAFLAASSLAAFLAASLRSFFAFSIATERFPRNDRIFTCSGPKSAGADWRPGAKFIFLFDRFVASGSVTLIGSEVAVNATCISISNLAILEARGSWSFSSSAVASSDSATCCRVRLRLLAEGGRTVVVVWAEDEDFDSSSRFLSATSCSWRCRIMNFVVPSLVAAQW